MKKPNSVDLRKVLVGPIANRDHQHLPFRIDRSQRVWSRTLQVDAESFGSGDGLWMDSVGGMCTSGPCPNAVALVPRSSREL